MTDSILTENKEQPLKMMKKVAIQFEVNQILVISSH